MKDSQDQYIPQNHTTGNSPRIQTTFVNTTPQIGVVEETMEKIDPNERSIRTHAIKAINKAALDRLISKPGPIPNNSRGRYDPSCSLSRFCFGDSRTGRRNTCPRTNPSLRKMLYIGCRSLKHTFSDRECTT